MLVLTRKATSMELLATTLLFTAIIAVRYLVVAGATYALLWRDAGPRFAAVRLNRDRPDGAVMRREIAASLIASPIYAFSAALAVLAFRHGHGAVYLDLSAHPLWWMPASLATYLLCNDAYYYWVHRALHHRRVFTWAHRGHHLSRQPTPYASFAFDAGEAAVSSALLPALTLVIPIQVGVALFLLTLMTVMAVLNHSGWEVWPQRWVRGGFGRWVISATHHTHHHTRLGCNFGLHFRLWDRLMRTDAMP